METNEKIIAIVFSVMLVLTLLPMVNAAAISVTWNTLGGTGNYSNKSGTFLFNCTVSAHKATNVTVYANTSAGVMNPLESFANTTASQTAWTGTVDIQAADDGSNQNLSCKAQNGTGTAFSNEKTASRVRLDSTSPNCNMTVLHKTIAFGQGNTITYYSSDVLARRTTTVDINGPGSQTTVTATAANGPLILLSNDTKFIGNWAGNMTVTDWSGNTCTDGANFTSYLPSGDEDEVAAQQQQTTQNNKFVWLLIIAGVLYFAFKKK